MSTPAGEFDPAALLRLLEVARRLAVPCELREILGAVIDAGREVLHAERGTVFLYDAPPRELYSEVAHGAQQIRLSIDSGIAGACARTRAIVNVPDAHADPRFNPEIDRQTGFRTRCILSIPLIGLDDELVGVLQLLNPVKPCFDAADEDLAKVLASQAAVAIQRARLIQERVIKLKLERDLELARQIQMGVLPQHLPVCPGYDLAAFSQPAEQTGGDIYDVVAVGVDAGKPPEGPRARGQRPSAAGQGAAAPAAKPETRNSKLLLLLADATGHGIGPALSVVQVRAMLRVGLRLAASLDELATHINRQLTEDLAATRFVTAFLGVLDPQTHEVRYHAAGQGPLLRYDAAGECCEWRDASTVPMGILPDAIEGQPPPLRMGTGDVLVLLTDGFYEYQNPAEQMFGKARVAQVVAEHREEGAQAILDALRAAVATFAAGAPQADDLTGVVVKRL
jgi:phosphoserine phosphatase